MPLTYEKRVLRVLQYIHEHPADDLSLDTLADVALMSRFHWHRVFQAMTGETCAEAVRRIRLYRAATWLANGQLPVAEIARRVGYPNIQSFTRAFKESYAVPPASFRKHGKPELSQSSKSRGKFIMFTVETTAMPRRRLGALEHKGAYSGVDQCFAQLVAIASQQNLWPRSGGMVGVHYHDPNVVAEADLRSHAGLIINDNSPLPDSLEEVIIDSGECAVLHYKGPYTAIKVAYDYLYGDWLPGSGREPADRPPFELYLNDPATTDEADLRTEVVLPLILSA